MGGGGGDRGEGGEVSYDTEGPNAQQSGQLRPNEDVGFWQGGGKARAESAFVKRVVFISLPPSPRSAASPPAAL